MTDEPTTDPLIVVHDLCFGYTASEVLHNVSFEIGEGDLVGIVGPNGGGKTTLLYLLLGLIKPKFGTVNIAGRPPREVRDRIGYVPQHLHFDPRFPVTALDVVNMGHLHGGRFGRFKRKEKDAARSALNQVGLADRQNQAFADLSGGERQRVMIARALVSQPSILFLDEPTANVDAQAEHALYELFHELNRSMTILLVSHNLTVVTKYVRHVLCVNRTACIHPISDMLSSTIKEAYGGELALLLHHVGSPITDVSRAMQSGHAAIHESSEGTGTP